MNDFHTSGILADILCRIFTAYIYPAGIYLGRKQVCGNFFIKNIKSVLSVYLYKLKIMVMIAQLHTKLIGFFAEHFCSLDYFGKLILTGTVFLRKIRYNHIFAAYLGINRKKVGVIHHINKRNVRGNRYKSYFAAHFLYLGGAFAEKSGKFNTVIT